jgi:hypothetical protein
VRFLFLGPVTALHDGVPADLGRRQGRLLLLEPGRPIPLPRLVDLLRPVGAPAGAREAVQTYLAGSPADLRPAGPAIVRATV